MGFILGLIFSGFLLYKFQIIRSFIFKICDVIHITINYLILGYQILTIAVTCGSLLFIGVKGMINSTFEQNIEHIKYGLLILIISYLIYRYQNFLLEILCEILSPFKLILGIFADGVLQDHQPIPERVRVPFNLLR